MSEKISGASMNWNDTLAWIRAEFPLVKSITSSELQSLMEKCEHGTNISLLMLDVRDEQEYNVSHIKHARRINDQDSIDEKISQFRKMIGHLDQVRNEIHVVAYCSVGYRSSRFVDQICGRYRDEDAGQVASFSNLEGGIFQWANESHCLVDNNSSRTYMVHPYNAVWGKLLQEEYREIM